MSSAVSNNVQYRLEEDGEHTVLHLVHDALGNIPESAFDGMPDGWKDQLNRIAERCG